MKPKKPRSVIGLTFSGGRLRAAHVVQAKGALEVAKFTSAALSLDLLHPEPKLIGREIRNHLQASRINEKACVVEVPPDWVMSQHTKLPDLPKEDVASFLQLEAEKGFPYDTAQLLISTSFHRSAEATYVTQLAVRRDRLEQLVAAVEAAGLRPVSLSLGLAALDGVVAPQGKGRITVALESAGTTMLVSVGGGIAAFRTFKVAIDSEAGENIFNGSAVSRELRLTVEQVPGDLRSDLRQISLRGDDAMVDQLAESLGDWPASVGLQVERAGSPGDRLADQVAEGLARKWLAGDSQGPELLPPNPGRLSLLVARYSSRRLAAAGLALGAVVAAALPVFLWQEIHLRLLRAEWGRMQAQATALSEIEDRIQDYRPWFDHSFPSLRILERVTQCFPENGSVTAKSFDIHDAGGLTTVSISGTVSDHRALLQTLDLLRKASEVQGLNVETISGKVPSQFTFTFRWIGGAGS
jgi:hypothetical protein